jgi:competence protein ComEC
VIAAIVAFVAGVGLLQLQAELPALVWSISLTGPVLLAALSTRKRRAMRACRLLAVLSFAFGTGFFWAALLASMRLADELPAAWEGQDIRVTGVVARLPQPFERGVRFEFDVETAAPAAARVPARIALSWYAGWHRDLPPESRPIIHAAERWEFSVRLKRPHGTANPHAFDYEAWLMERGIRATGYVRTGATQRRLDSLVPWPVYMIERARSGIRARILGTLQDASYAGVIAALVMGDQRAIPQTQWTVFTRTGVNHLMSISGLHVTMNSTLVFALVYGLWRRSARLCLRLPARRAAVVAGLAAALVYAAIAGFAVPAQRTVYMLAVLALALWLGRLSSPASVLALALLVVTVLDPWAVLAPGFWLSFGAVAAILYVFVGVVRTPHWALAWVRTQCAVTLGLIPLLLAMFQQISIVSPLANAIAIPVVSLAVVPLALSGAALPFDFLLHAAHGVMAALMALITWFASMPASMWQQHAPAPWAVAVALCGIAWMLLPRGFPARWVGVVGLLPLFLVVPLGPGPGNVWITVLDVGQGLAVVVRTHRHALLYDAGPRYSVDADSGSRIVLPYLRASGIRRLHGIVVTHADSDHAGGLASVLAGVPVDWMVSSLPDSSRLHAAVGSSSVCYAGQRWEWDGVRFEMLHPEFASYAVQRMKANDRSCVMRISARGRRVLLTGDAEARSERAMLARAAQALRAEILVAPHHGSTTSSTEAFIAAVRPELAIFTVGYRNRFRHPRAAVVRRYVDRGARILRSDSHGAVLLRVGSQGMQITWHRSRSRRYWHDKSS